MDELPRSRSLRTLLRDRRLVPLFALAAIALAVMGQFAFTRLEEGRVAIVLYAAALVLWIIVLFGSIGFATMHAPARADAPSPRRQMSRTLAVSTATLGLLTFLMATENTFTPDNVLVWVLSVAVFLYIFWEPEKTGAEWRAAVQRAIASVRVKWQYGVVIPWRALSLIAIMLLAVISFYHRLESIPAEMTADHAEKILDVYDVLQGERPIFFIRNTGREPLQFYLTAAFVALTGHPLDHMALKWITATLGFLAVPFTFFLAREMFGDDLLALLAAALVAVSKWLMMISRIGLRFSLTPFFVAPVMYFLFRALKYQKRNDFLMLGLCLGAGLYGYNAFRIVPLLVAFFFVWWLMVERNIRREDLPRYATNVLLVVFLALLVFMPLLRYMVDNPEMLWHRVLTRVTATEQELNGNPLLIFAENVKNVLLMFNVLGDQAWPNNISFDPALDFVMGGLFVLGIVTAVYRLARYRETMHAHLLIALFILLMPSALALAFPVENPGNARTGGAIPFVMIVTALPLVFVARVIRESLGTNTRAYVAAAGAVGLILLATTFMNYRRYFVQYDMAYRDESWNSTEVAATVRAFADSVGDLEHAWILLYPHWVDTRNVAVNLGEIAWQDHTLPDAEAATVHVGDGAPKLYLFHPNDRGNLTRVQEIFPNGQLRTFRARTPGHDFMIWYVPGMVAPWKDLRSHW